MLLETPTISELKTHFNGQVIEPGDAQYDEARTVFYGSFDRRPAAIIRALNAEDVSQVVSLARESGLALAVRGGGHSVAGHSTSEGGLVLDLSQMKGLEIDVAGRTAWAEAGLTAGEYTAAAAEHGLATGFGDTGTVGIGGLTLGGGIGFLVRKCGLTIDDLLAAEIVTADGQIRAIDGDNYPGLFWAIRGGGGNFGVVTRFKFRLHEVDRIVGGILILPATAETIAAVMAEAEAAPEELSAIVNVMAAPPMPFFPPEAHGKLVIMAMMVYAGDIAEGERVVGRFRALAEPIADMIRPMSYLEMYPPEEGGFHPLAVGRTMFVERVDRAMAETILDHLQRSTAMMRVAQLRVLGGAVARVPADATAFAHRTSKIMVNTAALYGPPAEGPVHEEWVSNFAAALKQGDNGVYVNFLSNEGESHVRAAYPGRTWGRLRAIKGQYDPTNLFRSNHNIPPAQE